jgi:hypothetical protein
MLYRFTGCRDLARNAGQQTHMLPHTGSTFLDINPISTTPQNQTKRPKKKRKKNHRNKERERECLAMKKIFALSRSLALSHGIQGREEQCLLRLQSPAPHPQTETKKTTGEWARFVEIATGKNERTSRGSLTVIRTNESG